MTGWTSRIIILSLLGIVIGVPLVLSAKHDAAANEGRDANAARLIIFSPHNEQIRYELTRAYNLWRAAKELPAVEIDWRTSGGSSDLRKQILDQFNGKAMVGREDDGIGADLFFGGGEYEHNKLVGGVTVDRDGGMVRIPVSVPIILPDGFRDEAFPSQTIGGELLYHSDFYWFGAALSSFGIVYNQDLVRMRSAPEPRTWTDLEHPAFDGWIALADPGHSGSAGATYNVIVRRNGWDEGWRSIRRIFANSRYFTAGATKVPVDVSAGEAAAGMAIDFYGRFQAGAIGGDRIGYSDPPGMTAITSDPISILRGAPRPELALEFVVFVLSREGQQLWQKRVGTPGGPERFELRRLPVRRDLYTPSHMADWVDQVHPFDEARAMAPGVPDYYFAIAPIAHAMAIDIHDDLSAAWRTLRAHEGQPVYAEMEQLFYAMPDALTITWPDDELRANWQTIAEDPTHTRFDELKDLLKTHIGSVYGRWSGDQKEKDRINWTRFFQGNYRKIVKLGKETPAS